MSDPVVHKVANEISSSVQTRNFNFVGVYMPAHKTKKSILDALCTTRLNLPARCSAETRRWKQPQHNALSQCQFHNPGLSNRVLPEYSQFAMSETHPLTAVSSACLRLSFLRPNRPRRWQRAGRDMTVLRLCQILIGRTLTVLHRQVSSNPSVTHSRCSCLSGNFPTLSEPKNPEKVRQEVPQDTSILACDAVSLSKVCGVSKRSDCFTLKMKDLRSSETPGTTRPMTQRHIPQDLSLHQHRCENLT